MAFVATRLQPERATLAWRGSGGSTDLTQVSEWFQSAGITVAHWAGTRKQRL